MKTFSVSTSAMSQSLRYSLLRSQGDLVKAQTESQSGKVADTGLALGSRTGQAVSFRRDLDRIQGIVDSNGVVSSRLKAAQSSLDQVGTAAQTFLSALTATSATGGSDSIAKSSADTMMGALTSALNGTYNGEYLFAGINTDVKPFQGFGEGSPAKAAFDGAFQSFFGFPQTDNAAANISGSQMDAFLTSVEPQFLGSGWEQNWSNASDEPIVSRITLNETSTTSVSANTDGAKKLAMAAAIVSSLFDGKVSAAGHQAASAKALSLASEATSAVTATRADLGTIEQRVSTASDRLNTQLNLFEKQVGNLVDVDPYEAATRVNDLLSHIQTSYALTARIQNLSILNYLN